MSEINELKKILQNHEKRISSLEKLLSSKPPTVSTDDESVILSLIKNGFFNQPKKISEITKELKIKAKFNKNAKYTSILTKLTSEEKLIRKQSSHQWTYKKND